MADKVEAKMMAIFPMSIMVLSSNAKSVIKILIVNPIPASKLTPAMCFQFKPVGNFATPMNTAKLLNKIIPIGFPAASPPMIPVPILDESPETQLYLKTIQVLAKANSGRIIKATG